MKLGSRRVRLKAIWLLLIPFLYLARPTPSVLIAGGALALVGAGIRAWAAGHIRKDAELSTSGPYAHTRNPLYLGSLFIGLGVTVAGGSWIFVALFLLFFFLVYRRTMRHEEEVLTEEFGDAYRRYRREVPLLVPRLSPYRDPKAEPRGAPAATGSEGGVPAESAGFRLRRYLRNREWEAALGLGAGFAFLVAKMVWMG